MAGKLILSGGGNEKQTYALDEVLLKETKKIIYIPLAWPNEDFESCLKWFKNMINSHKKDISIKMMVDLGEDVNLGEFDAIYLGGGNTFKLLKKIKESNFDKKIIEFYKSGKIVYGGSAGAIILGNKIDIALICKDKDENKVELKNTNGLDLISGCDIQCHFEIDQIKEHLEFFKESRRKIICIPEESALLVEGTKFKVIGLKPITTISHKKICSWEVGEKISLE